MDHRVTELTGKQAPSEDLALVFELLEVSDCPNAKPLELPNTLELMVFEFATAQRIVFGQGCATQLDEHSAALMSRALLVTGKDRERHTGVIERLVEAGLELTWYGALGEPRIEDVDVATRLAREAGCDGVIAIGGGSAIDTGKAIAALIPNPGSALRYVEVIGDGERLQNASLPFVAVPTTSGTGAEVTKNAVLGSEAHGVKVSLRSNSMLPALALVDSTLTHSVPKSVSAATGLDALTQVIEPFVSRFANPLTDGLCREAIRRGPSALRRIMGDGNDAPAREDMALVSLFGGLALANAKLGAVHGFAGPLGGLLGAHHGALCARLLPVVTRINLRALKQRDKDSPALPKFKELAELLTGNRSAQPEDAVTSLEALSNDVGTESLGSMGLTEAQFADTVDKAQRASSMRGNPLVLQRDELFEILEHAL
jgi:alcohol dehydrogenase class IV